MYYSIYNYLLYIVYLALYIRTTLVIFRNALKVLVTGSLVSMTERSSSVFAVVFGNNANQSSASSRFDEYSPAIIYHSLLPLESQYFRYTNIEFRLVEAHCFGSALLLTIRSANGMKSCGSNESRRDNFFDIC